MALDVGRVQLSFLKQTSCRLGYENKYEMKYFQMIHVAYAVPEIEYAMMGFQYSVFQEHDTKWKLILYFHASQLFYSSKKKKNKISIIFSHAAYNLSP